MPPSAADNTSEDGDKNEALSSGPLLRESGIQEMTLSSGSRCQSKRVGTAWLAAACLQGAAAAAEVPATITQGSIVTLKDATGREWCATVIQLVHGPGADWWAWVRFNADPRRIDHAPVGELTPGCGPA